MYLFRQEITVYFITEYFNTSTCSSDKKQPAKYNPAYKKDAEKVIKEYEPPLITWRKVNNLSTLRGRFIQLAKVEGLISTEANKSSYFKKLLEGCDQYFHSFLELENQIDFIYIYKFREDIDKAKE